MSNTVQHAQSAITELRIAIEQLATCDDEHLFVERWQDIASIMGVIQFDLNEMRKIKLEEF